MCNPHIINTCWLTVNRKCQLRCRWCYAQDGGYTSEQDMKLEQAFQIIDIMQGLGTQTCKLLGGEPSLYPHLTDVLAHLRTSGICSVMITNGLVYADKRIIQEHFAAGLDSLVISLKAGTPESYKRLTGAPVFGKVCAAVGNLADFKGGVTITITEEIKDEIVPAIRSIVYAGARFINLHFCSPTLVSGLPENHSMLEPNIAAETLLRAVECLDALPVTYNVQISIPFCLFPSSFIQTLIEKKCLTSGCIVNKKSGLIFGPQGEVGFCNHMMDYPFGKYGVNFSN